MNSTQQGYARLLEFRKNQKSLIKHGYDITRIEDLEDLLYAERINSFLYASDVFIQRLASFIEQPNMDNLQRTAVAMRKDLWGLKTKIKI